MEPRFITARDAQRKFGYLLQMALHLPVTIQKHGRNVAVILSKEEYDRLQELEDKHWGEKAAQAKKRGKWLSTKESETLLNNLLDAENTH